MNKYFLPVCETCLEPFENWELMVFVNPPVKTYDLRDVKFFHKACIVYAYVNIPPATAIKYKHNLIFEEKGVENERSETD